MIMASTSREKSSKCMSSMASSDTRGMLAAYKSTRYKSSQVHQLFQALHPALLSCLSDMPHKSDLTFTYTLIQLNSELEMSFVSELLMPQANEEEGTGGGRGKLICRKNTHTGSGLLNLEYKAVWFTETAVRQYIQMHITEHWMQETSGQPAAVNFNCCYSGEGRAYSTAVFLAALNAVAAHLLFVTHAFCIFRKVEGISNTSLVQNVFLHRIEMFGGLMRACVSLKE